MTTATTYATTNCGPIRSTSYAASPYGVVLLTLSDYSVLRTIERFERPDDASPTVGSSLRRLVREGLIEEGWQVGGLVGWNLTDRGEAALAR